MTISVLVTADTHLPKRGRELPLDLLRAADKADVIVHLGDFVERSILQQMRQLGTLEAVHGNVDSIEVKEALPERKLIKLGGRELLLLHGHRGGRSALEAARARRSGEVVLFGHSHQPYQRMEEGRLLFNPGSPTEKRFAPYRSFGWLEIGETIEARIVELV